MKNSPEISKIKTLEILDSRGNPTVRVMIETKDGKQSFANVPSGASTGTREALELRDGNPKKYHGKGVSKALKNIEKKIFPLLKGWKVTKQKDVDKFLIKLDNTENKSKLGANAILGVSLACARAGANHYNLPLFRYLQKTFGFKKAKKMPNPMLNLINGGAHADSGIDIQEFMVIPAGIRPFSKKMRAASEIFIALGKLLQSKKLSTAVGNEGGYAPRVNSNIQVLKLIDTAIKNAGYKVGKDMFFGIDAAASEFYNSKQKKYNLKLDKKKFNSAEIIKMYETWMKKYPFLLMEDPLAEDDWESWSMMQEKVGKKLTIIGDDLTVTNTKWLAKAIKEKTCNAVLIKVNQIGSLTETIECIKLAQKNKFKVAVSHRSGETCDSFISDLTVATGADFIKSGAPSRSERLAKYNRLLEIESWEK